MMERVYRLGQENAKLALKIRNQRLKLRELTGPVKTQVHELAIRGENAQREVRILKDQNHKLIIENNALRLIVAGYKRIGETDAITNG